MAGVLISAALKAVPRKMLLTQAPVIIHGANTLISKLGEIRQGPRKDQEELSIRLKDFEDRLNTLEGNQTSQADLFKEIATQLDGLTESLRIIAARAWIATMVSIGAVGSRKGVRNLFEPIPDTRDRDIMEAVGQEPFSSFSLTVGRERCI